MRNHSVFTYVEGNYKGALFNKGNLMKNIEEYRQNKADDFRR